MKHKPAQSLKSPLSTQKDSFNIILISLDGFDPLRKHEQWVSDWIFPSRQSVKLFITYVYFYPRKLLIYFVLLLVSLLLFCKDVTL